MPRPPRLRPAGLALLLLSVAGAAGCASVRLNEGAGRYAREEAALEAALQRRPTDAAALRDLGVIHVRTRRYPRAYDLLRQALAADPRDAKTRFHLGLAAEAVGDRTSAARIYGGYADVPRTSPYRRLMVGRFGLMLREDARREARAALAAEDTVSAAAAPNVVAVYPLRYGGGDDRFAPLAPGLAEMIAEDLLQVSRLRVVERTRLAVILDEIRRAQSDRFDPASRPRAGRLLGAGRVVSGAYDVTGRQTLRVDLAHYAAGPNADALTGTDALANVFALEKQLVFDLLAAMQITPTEEERARIEPVPTRNLQAFLAYCLGLEREDAGAFRAAATAYARAVRLDPAFTRAATRQEAADGMAAAGGEPDDAAITAAQLELPVDPFDDLLGYRIGALDEGVRTGQTTGADSRKPAQEGPGFPRPPARPPRDLP